MDAISHKCDVVSSDWTHWHQIHWFSSYQAVRRLQTRIAKATQLGDWRKARRLQRLLIRSSSAKAVAVRRVTENRGRKTPGVDGITWSTPESKMMAVRALEPKGYRPKPLRRIHIPKANGGKRPLGIPTMHDRAMQALYLLALEPVAETTADPNSYGFRPERSTADAIVQCRNALGRSHSPEWVLDADIKGCFDNISHDWMVKHVPMDVSILKKWLKAGYVAQGRLFPTQAGTPQGGIISPTLANLVLDGLERGLKEHFPRRAKLNVVRYADDFVVTASSRDILEDKVKPWIEAFLAERGLTLSPTKTEIRHITEGFDFVGWNVCKRQGKLLIVPGKGNVKAFYQKVRDLLRRMRTAPQAEVIHALNPVLRGWAYYHRSQMASRTFAKMDHKIFTALWRWALRRHPNKGKRWVRRRYFQTLGPRQWVFTDGTQTLIRLSDVKIRRHNKIKSDANPHDPAWGEYFDSRTRERMLQTLAGQRKVAWLWKRQAGICPICRQQVTSETGWHLHHRIWRTHGGSDEASNLVMLHPDCHRQYHAVAGSPVPSVTDGT
ncbi:group II intron reverse transcriptase/maturase [Ectothiorhodospira mobilis]|uniref:group II intron reverse transcriptase/maturase n=1 Tax=Ectothiorhodospira mobilis TaxID=195064 RepID=UPI001EE841A4|nr:group II intron reverse transcriptase/maturase [Ectothiorhodospira mobilis]MCG5536186.1 group II intron reverse transcriptase/maturase [Ectothiorhodospira mobilis]